MEAGQIVELISAIAKLLGPIGALLPRRKQEPQPFPPPIKVITVGHSDYVELREQILKSLDREPVDLSAEFRVVRIEVLAASSDAELQTCLFKTEELLTRDPQNVEGRSLQLQIKQFIASQRNIAILVLLQLMLWYFVLFQLLVAARIMRQKNRSRSWRTLMWRWQPEIEGSRAFHFRKVWNIY